MQTEYSIPRTQNPLSVEPAETQPAASGTSFAGSMPAPATFGGIGIGGMLFIIFLVLKLAQVKPFAKWSYWRVTAPLWIPVLVGMVIVVIVYIFSTIKNR